MSICVYVLFFCIAISVGVVVRIVIGARSEFKNIVLNAIKIIWLMFPRPINGPQLQCLMWKKQSQRFGIIKNRVSSDPLSPDDLYKVIFQTKKKIQFKKNRFNNRKLVIWMEQICNGIMIFFRFINQKNWFLSFCKMRCYFVCFFRRLGIPKTTRIDTYRLFLNHWVKFHELFDVILIAHFLLSTI